MKKVFSTSSEVMHLFANQRQEQATNQSRNAYFNLYGLFSYGSHYQLAKHLKGGAILINDLGYSVTTSKHINEISQASRHKTQFYSSNILIDEVLPTIEGLLKKLPKARTRKLEYIATIKALFNSFQKFQQYAKDNNIKALRWSNNNIIKAQIDKRGKEYKRLLFIAKNMQNLDILESEVIKEKARQDKKEATKQRQLIKAYRNKKTNFARLKNDLLSLRYDIDKSDNLEHYIHTSQNVRITLNDGIKAIEGLEALKYSSCKINAYLKGEKIGWHTIKGAQNNALIVGCHSIKFEEIKRLAKQINKLN